MNLITVDIVSASLTIWDFEIATKIYRLGYFGKPLGVRKAIPGKDIDRPLTLSFFDALYLIEINIIQVRKDNIMTKEEFIEYANNHFDNFIEKYGVYQELRKLGYVVRPGMKFGTDFIIYQSGPGIDHSKWAVLVENDDSNLQAINIVRAGRLAHSVKKVFLIATKNTEKHRYFSFSRFKL